MTASVDNKEMIERYLQALSGRAKTPQLVAGFVSDPTLVEHIRQVESAFPSYELIPDDLVAERNLVAMRGTFRGVHRGVFGGIQPTGRLVSAPLMIFYRIDAGRIAEHWLQFDAAGLVSQLTAGAEPVAARR